LAALNKSYPPALPFIAAITVLAGQIPISRGRCQSSANAEQALHGIALIGANF
jgi:hypothetical protein